MDLEIAKILVLSTGHVTEKDMSLLTIPKSYPYTKLNTGYGAMVYLPTDMIIPIEQSIDFITDDKAVEHKEKLLAFSKDFRRLLKLAQEQDCQWLHLDRDGELHDELPSHEW